MTIFQAIIIGIIQGITEFIPISSSGHLVLVQYILKVEHPGITFEIFVHFGSLFSVFYCFYKDIIDIIKGFFSFTASLFNRNKKLAKDADSHNLLLKLIIATAITGIIGISFKGIFEDLFKRPLFVVSMLIVTGFILLLASVIKIGNKGDREISALDSVIVGLSQSFAILPGISRSGSTITGAYLRGLNKDTAIRYSFLLSIPAILGATLLEMMEIMNNGLDIELLTPYIIGTIASAISGIFAIKILIKVLKKDKLQYFAVYCIMIGIIGIIYFLFFQSP